MNRLWRGRRDGRQHQVLSLSMVKNEQDIIEPFIRHTARLVDAMVILDNASVDETRRIAMDCARELGTVIVADSYDFAYTQAERMTRLLHHCQAAFFADFVMFLDADEFIECADRASLLAVLGTIPVGGVGHLPWRTFVLGPDDEAPDPPRSMRRRRRSERQTFHKAVLRLDGAYRPELRVLQGNHGVLDGAGEPLAGPSFERPKLLHFPVRSRGQLASKAVVGWMANLAANPLAGRDEQAFQWREAFERVVSTPGGVGAIDASGASLAYARDPQPGDLADTVEDAPPSDYARRHSTGAFAEPVAVIARSWERSLVSPAPLLELSRPTFEVADGVGATSFDGAWHWDFLFVDIAPFRFVVEKHRPASVLDVGCGIGQYLRLCRKLGVERVFGVDGVPAAATVLSSDEYLVQDLGQALDLGRTFDLVICVEVAEHLDARLAETLLDSVARHAGDKIVFSAAEPGQPGHGHINGQPIAHWLERWAARGWYPDVVETLGMRSLATLAWFRRNLIVFRRRKAPGSIDALRSIGDRRFNWYGQEPGIRELALCEPLPPPPAGYAVT